MNTSRRTKLLEPHTTLFHRNFHNTQRSSPIVDGLPPYINPLIKRGLTIDGPRRSYSAGVLFACTRSKNAIKKKRSTPLEQMLYGKKPHLFSEKDFNLKVLSCQGTYMLYCNCRVWILCMKWR